MSRPDPGSARAPTPATTAGWLRNHRDLSRLEAELLLCHHLDCTRARLLAHPEQPISAPQALALERDAARLAAGEPLAYVLGEWEFWDFTLELTPAVLIPRPETETLVEQALIRIAPGDRVLDLGTGSGAVAIAIARERQASVLAVDASEAALAVAEANVARLARQVSLRRSDWYAEVSGSFQVIVANPPYVAERDPHLDDLGFEPRQALVAGPRGLDDLRIIIRDAPAHLSPGGWLLVEHGYDQATAVGELFAAAGFEAVELVRDLGGRPRVTLGRRQAG